MSDLLKLKCATGPFSFCVHCFHFLCIQCSQALSQQGFLVLFLGLFLVKKIFVLFCVALPLSGLT